MINPNVFKNKKSIIKEILTIMEANAFKHIDEALLLQGQKILTNEDYQVDKITYIKIQAAYLFNEMAKSSSYLIKDFIPIIKDDKYKLLVNKVFPKYEKVGWIVDCEYGTYTTGEAYLDEIIFTIDPNYKENKVSREELIDLEEE